MERLPSQIMREVELVGPRGATMERVTRTVITGISQKNITLVECKLSLTTELTFDGEPLVVSDEGNDSAEEAFEILTGLSPLAFDAMYFGVREIDVIDVKDDEIYAPYRGELLKSMRIVNPVPRPNGNV